MPFFVKDLIVHKYPLPFNCRVRFFGQKLYNSPPTGYKVCGRCFPELLALMEEAKV